MGLFKLMGETQKICVEREQEEEYSSTWYDGMTRIISSIIKHNFSDKFKQRKAIEPSIQPTLITLPNIKILARANSKEPMGLYHLHCA